VDGGDADGGEVADGEFLVSAGAKSWCAARGCAVWLADLLGFARVTRVRFAWSWFARGLCSRRVRSLGLVGGCAARAVLGLGLRLRGFAWVPSVRCLVLVCGLHGCAWVPCVRLRWSGSRELLGLSWTAHAVLALVRGLCGVRMGAAPAIVRSRGGVRLAEREAGLSV